MPVAGYPGRWILPGSPFRKRAPVPLYINWRIALFIFGLYALASLGSHAVAGRLGNGWIWATSLITPFNHVATITLLAPIPWLLVKARSPFWRFVQGLTLSLVTCEIAVVVIVLLDAWFMQRAGVVFSRLPRLLQLYLLLVGPSMMVLGGLIAARATAEGEKEIIQEEAMIAKTRLLQSQLHPHVLFNALNGLAELIHKDPPSAERSVGHLANLLRRILRASDQPTFPLGEERSLVEDYLFLEAMRLGNRLKVEWDWDPALNFVPVPPLLIQPLVENAIKHGIAPSPGGGHLVIRAQALGQDLRLEVWNSGEPFKPERGSGIGLRNLEDRLALMYGPSARFTSTLVDGGTLAAILLPGALLEWNHDQIASPRCG